jgi:hypothetical protein
LEPQGINKVSIVVGEIAVLGLWDAAVDVERASRRPG